jgi:hypothetical protein
MQCGHDFSGLLYYADNWVVVEVFLFEAVCLMLPPLMFCVAAWRLYDAIYFLSVTILLTLFTISEGWSANEQVKKGKAIPVTGHGGPYDCEM